VARKVAVAATAPLQGERKKGTSSPYPADASHMPLDAGDRNLNRHWVNPN